MSINVKDGQLQRTINSAGDKLVAVDFSNEGCPPCRAIHPYWESLVEQYPTIIFCTVMCSECPTESQNYQIRATPTFVFIRHGKEIERFEGADKNKIKACLEKHKNPFLGQARTLGGVENNNDFFADLMKKKKGAQAQQTTQPQPAAPVVQPKPAPAIPEIPQGLLDDLKEMGFDEERIKNAYVATRGGDLERIITYFENQQSNPPPAADQVQTLQAETANSEPTEHQQSGKQQQVANDLVKDLTPEGQQALETIVSMGYDAELAQIAINSVGPSSIERCIDIIGKIQRGEPIPMPKHQLTKEEKEAKLAHYKELIAKKRETVEKPSPKKQAQEELARRKQIQDSIEAKEKFEERQRLLAIEEAKKQKIKDQMDREEVRKKILAQREAQKRANQGQTTKPTAPAQPKPASGPKKPVTEYQLRLQFPDGKAQVQKFKPEDTFLTVEQWIRANVPSSAGKTITFQSTFPSFLIAKSDFEKTLQASELAPRSQLSVLFS